MSDDRQDTSETSRGTTSRFRDFLILTSGGVGVITILLITGAIGLVEWITAGIVLVAGALAYFVGSSPSVLQRQLHTAQSSRSEDKAPNSMAIVGPYLKALPFPALLVGRDQRIAFANAGTQDVFRLPNLEGMLASAAIRQPDLLAAVTRIAATGAPEQIDFSLRDNTESWRAHMRAGPKPGSVLIILEDTTAVRRAEQARADFLANASHELRTPLTAIAGFIETMRGPAKDDKASWDGFLDIMFHQAERMKRLVADLLSLSRIEFSEHRAPSTKVDLSGLVSSCGLSLQPIANEAHVSLNVEGAGMPATVIGDADELTQVLQNLTSNALKYAPPDSTVRIEVGVSPSMAEAALQSMPTRDAATRTILLTPRASSEVPAVWIRIEDEGPGIPPQHLPRLGERFYRVDESRGGKIEGTGLGLAIVKHIMARHRGGLAVESQKGHGSTFAVWMPRETV